MCLILILTSNHLYVRWRSYTELLRHFLEVCVGNRSWFPAF